jgi:calcineurin-like phosphoesterase family protein
MESAILDGRDRDVRTRVWLISDLQVDDPSEARRCLGTAIEDVVSLEQSPDQIWYLGDGVMGFDLDRVEQLTDVQIDLLERLDCPLRYVMGNHDIDYAKKTGEVALPLHEAVRSHSTWRTTERPEDFYFVEELDGLQVLFLADHVDREGRWSVTHGRIHGDADRYPHSEADYRAVVERLADRDKPVIVAGHNAFPGGNRPAELQRRLFPLPEHVRLHVYGHAHIGDEKHVGENAYRTISYVDDHRIPQVDVASLEDLRGDTIRSAFLEVYTNGDCGVYFRDHSGRNWLEAYVDCAASPTGGE